MNDRETSPERLVCTMSDAERRELLHDLGIEASTETAQRLKLLVQQFGSVERAVEAIAGAPRMRKAG